MTRIALRELADADLEETTAELSQVAEICIREVFDWNAKLRESIGSPAADLAVLAWETWEAAS